MMGNLLTRVRRKKVKMPEETNPIQPEEINNVDNPLQEEEINAAIDEQTADTTVSEGDATEQVEGDTENVESDESVEKKSNNDDGEVVAEVEETSTIERDAPHGTTDPNFNCEVCQGDGLILATGAVCSNCQGTGKVA